MLLPLCLLFLAVAACGEDPREDPVPKREAPSCPYSTASTGEGSCQVDFFCDEGERSIHCLGDAQGGSSCSCTRGAADGVEPERHDLCALELEERIEVARDLCGWSI